MIDQEKPVGLLVPESRAVNSSKILLAGHFDWLDSIGSVLQESGIQLVTTRQPKEVFEQVRQTTPVAVILGVSGNDRAGIQICRQIKSDRLLKNIPVVLIGLREEHALTPSPGVEALSVGADDYLEVPLDDEFLLAKIERLFKRRRDENVLLESEERFRAVFESSPVAIAIAQRDRLRQVNTAYRQLFGFENPSELKDVSLLESLTPRDREWIAGLIEHVEEERLDVPFETTGIARNGEEIPLRIRIRRTRISDSDHTLVFISDISENKKAEQSWRESEEYFRAVAETATDSIITFEENNRIIFVNSATERTFGYDRGELIGAPITNLISENFRGRLVEILRNYLRTGKKTLDWSCVELTGISRAGENLPLEVSLSEFTRGGKRFFTGIMRDVSEKKRAEDALRESEESYRNLVENATDIIYTHDLEGRYTSLNRAGEQITGYTREEAAQLKFTDVLAYDQVEKARQCLADKLAGKEETYYQIDILTKDKKRKTIEVNTRLIYKGGVPVGVQGVGRDITERRSLEEQLHHAQKMESIGRLAGGVAHDFNNLLSVINGYADLLLMRHKPAEEAAVQKIKAIREAGERASLLTRQLLAFSRRQVLQPRLINLNDIINETGRMLKRLLGENIKLIFSLRDDLGIIKADAGQIDQILVNLAVNARDSMPGGGKIIIETANVYLDDVYGHDHVQVKPGNYVMLSVSDTGVGIDEETQKRIFEPFFTTKEMGKGTGLGLATVYGIVKQSEGFIWVYSEPGHGTAFKIYLPRVDTTEPESEEPPQSPELLRGTETILVVEDDENVRDVIGTVLELLGYRVVSAASGEEALEICRRLQGELDLLISDVIMSGISGRELVNRLTLDKPDFKVLYISGYTDDAIVHHGVLNEGVPFLQKPFTPSALAAKVRSILDAEDQ